MSKDESKQAEREKATKAQQHGMQGVAKALAAQRDAAHAREVDLSARNEILTAALEEANARVKALEADVEALKPKAEPPPADAAAKAAAEAASRGQPKVVKAFKANGKDGKALPGLP